MNYKKHFNKILAILLAGSILFSVSSCKKDEDKPAPEIPPESTFVMEFKGFENDDTTATRDIETYQNWWWAASHVKVWNTLIKIGLAIPTASFLESFKHPAIYDPGSDSWTFTYNFWVLGIAHKATLHASIVAEGILWEMFISKDGEYTDFLWYYGVSDPLNHEGYWVLNNNPQNNQPLLEITWHRDPAGGTADIKYENILPGGAENGGYIYYGLTNDTPYNAYYNIYNKSADNLKNIEWHLTNIEGRVKDPVHFGDPDWHCWNNLFQDTTCP